MATGKVKILVVDDDKNICDLYPLYFTKEGYETVICNNGKEAIKKISEDVFSLVLLDVMMPEMDGIDTLQHIRQKSNIPVIMVSAKGEKVDIIGGLEYGADDYVTKPVEMQELISRIKAILRRVQPMTMNDRQDAVVGNLFVSISNYVVKVDGVKKEMPPKEIELLYHFVTHPMVVFSREQLLASVWEENYDGDTRTVDVHIKRIREKLSEGQNISINSNWSFKTVWGKGYKFEIE